MSGSETVFLVLLALIILGPEKLPDAIRKFGKAYSEFRKMASGFQTEMRSALDEPMREMRETTDALRKAANLDGLDEFVQDTKNIGKDTKKFLNFDVTTAPVGGKAATTAVEVPDAAAPSVDAADTSMTMPSSAVDGTDAPIDLPESPVIKRAAGISFGSANPRQPVDRPVPSEADVRVDTDTDTEPATASEPATQELVAE